MQVSIQSQVVARSFAQDNLATVNSLGVSSEDRVHSLLLYAKFSYDLSYESIPVMCR